MTTTKNEKVSKVCFTNRTVVGLTETIKVKHDEGRHPVIARIDTGATKSSMDILLASKMKLGPVVASKLVKSANGAHLRPMVEVGVIIEGREVKARFTLADRGHMKYKVLIGQNILKKNFIIDPMR